MASAREGVQPPSRKYASPYEIGGTDTRLSGIPGFGSLPRDDGEGVGFSRGVLYRHIILIQGRSRSIRRRSLVVKGSSVQKELQSQTLNSQTEEALFSPHIPSSSR